MHLKLVHAQRSGWCKYKNLGCSPAQLRIHNSPPFPMTHLGSYCGEFRSVHERRGWTGSLVHAFPRNLQAAVGGKTFEEHQAVW
eukprot:5029078-Amphidinium_carterae.1